MFPSKIQIHLYSTWLSLLQFMILRFFYTFDGKICIIWKKSWRSAKQLIWYYQSIFLCFISQCIDHQMPSLLAEKLLSIVWYHRCETAGKKAGLIETCTWPAGRNKPWQVLGCYQWNNLASSWCAPILRSLSAIEFLAESSWCGVSQGSWLNSFIG